MSRTVTLSAGAGKRFGLGFCIDKYSISIDLLCIWIGVDW